MKVNEIFYSLQGEGAFTGTPALFVRFSGCNLKCDFCDTAHESGEDIDVNDLIDVIAQCPAQHVILTGGEPTLQITPIFVALLKRAKKIVHLETNGTRRIDPEIESLIDWVTVSPKFGVLPVIQRIDELKVVFDVNHREYIERLADVKITNEECYYLQPCDRNDADYNSRNIAECINYIKQNPKWKLSLQTHKMLGLR